MRLGIGGAAQNISKLRKKDNFDKSKTAEEVDLRGVS